MPVGQETLACIGAGTKKLADIAAVLKAKEKAIVTAVQQLKARGLVQIVQRGEYEITEAGKEWMASGRVIAGGQISSRKRTVTKGIRQRAWWVLRARKSATLPELLTALADGSEKDAPGNLRRYLKALLASGFVKTSPKRVPGNTPTSNGYLRYTLVRNNGRLSPVFRKADSTVFDPNTGEVFKLETDQ